MSKFRKVITTLGVALMAIGPNFSYASEVDETEIEEKIGIFVRGLKICHQHEWRNLTVELEYGTQIDNSHENAQEVKKYVKEFLDKYSNPDDFWEIMNVKLVDSLLKNFTGMQSVKSTLILAPDKTLKFPRSSIVNYERGEETLRESFSFTKQNFLICEETFHKLNLHVKWDMKKKPGNFDYPDYQWVNTAIEKYFAKNSVCLSKWSKTKHELVESLLKKFKTLVSVHIEATVIE